MIIKNGLYDDYYCNTCGALLEDDKISFRNNYFCDLDCYERFLLKNSIKLPYGVSFDDELYNSFKHLYYTCLKELNYD